jgi:peptidoglycan/xylan/chitin deacetylase (PgdA/CDA1 family)
VFSGHVAHALGTPAVVGLDYHGVTPGPLPGVDDVWGKHIAAATFRQHLETLARHFHVIRLSDLLRSLSERVPLPRRSVFITFDDGYAGVYEVAYPLLREFGMPATFFVTSAHTESGAPLRLDVLDAMLKYTTRTQAELVIDGPAEPLPLARAEDKMRTALRVRRLFKALPPERQLPFLADFAAQLGFDSLDAVPPLGPHTRLCTVAQLREMAAGGIEIGSHTHTHQTLAAIRPELAREELRVSKAWLENQLDRACPTFCYPNGHYPRDGNDVTTDLVREAGYRCAVYMHGGVNTRATDPFYITRSAAGAHTGEADLLATLNAVGPRVKGWLGRDPSPSAISIRAARKRLAAQPSE